MKIHEYQAKELLAQYGLPIPPGHVATTPEEARAAASQIGGTVVIKAQVLVGGRGKAGGVKLAATPDEAAEKAADDPRHGSSKASRCSACWLRRP